MLENLERGADTRLFPRVQSVLDRDDELGNDRENLVGTVFQHVMNALSGEKLVGMSNLAESVKEKWEIVMEVQLLDLYLPCNLVAFGVVFQLDGKVSSFVEFSEGSGFCWTFLEGVSTGRTSDFGVLHPSF